MGCVEGGVVEEVVAGEGFGICGLRVRRLAGLFGFWVLWGWFFLVLDAWWVDGKVVGLGGERESGSGKLTLRVEL